MLALLLLSMSPAVSQDAGNEWDILNQEVVELYHAGKYDRAVVVAKKALEVAETLEQRAARIRAIQR